MKSKQLSIKIVLSLALLAAVLFFVFLYINNDIGIQGSKIESDILSSQKIDDTWHITGEVSDIMAAYISYPEDLSDHTFSVYVKHPGLSFGYFFRCGGGLGSVDTSITEFTLDGYNERAFISMNQRKVNRLVLDDGNALQTIEIDSSKPFAIVLLGNAGVVTFYTEDGNTAEITEYSL
jgi:hypothetical protein